MRPRITPEQWPLSPTVLGPSEKTLEHSTDTVESVIKLENKIENNAKVGNRGNIEQLCENKKSEKVLTKEGKPQELEEWKQVKNKRQRKGRIGGNSLTEENKTLSTELDFQFDEEIDDKQKER